MSLPLTKEVLALAYDYLAATPPFRSWNLPPAEEIDFRVVRGPKYRGWYTQENGKHIIAISSRNIGRTDSLMSTMAHEMIHLHQRDTKSDASGVQHNTAFEKLAARVCKFHGFDPHLF